MSKDHEPLVDDASLSDPRFLRSAVDSFKHFIEEGNEDAAERIARELLRAGEAGEDVLSSRYWNQKTTPTEGQ